MRALATIQRIENVEPIVGKDRVEMVTVLGWKCMVSKKDNFQPNDLCIFCEPDSVFPKEERWSFLKKYNYRIKTQKFKDGNGNIIYSQGLVLPIETLSEGHFVVGSNVTNLLGITEYGEDNVIENMPTINGKTKKYPKWLMRFKWFRNLINLKKYSTEFPSWIAKTDEIRIQSNPKILEDNLHQYWMITEKLDGTSATYAIKKHKRLFGNKWEFFVCSRNLRKVRNDNSVYWEMVDKYNIKKFLIDVCKYYHVNSFIIQGEIIGPNIQKNKYKLTSPELRIFNMTLPGGRLDYKSMLVIINTPAIYNNISLVPYLGQIHLLNVEEAIECSKGTSQLYDTPREGIVCRNSDNNSFKAINPEFLIKYNL